MDRINKPRFRSRSAPKPPLIGPPGSSGSYLRDYGNFPRLIPRSAMLFVLWGKSHVRSVLHTDLVKIAQPEHSGELARKCRSQGESAQGQTRSCRWGKEGLCPYGPFRLFQELAATFIRLDGAESGAGLRGHLVRSWRPSLRYRRLTPPEVAFEETSPDAALRRRYILERRIWTTCHLPRDSSGKPFLANADIENKGLPACKIAKKRLSGFVSRSLSEY